MKVDIRTESALPNWGPALENFASSFNDLIRRIIAYVGARLGACFGYSDEIHEAPPESEPIQYTKTNRHLIKMELPDDGTVHFWINGHCCTIEISEEGEKLTATLQDEHIQNDLLFSFGELIGTLFSRSDAEHLEIKIFRDTHYYALTRQGLGQYDGAIANQLANRSMNAHTIVINRSDVPLTDRIEQI